jgi:Fic family protein
MRWNWQKPDWPHFSWSKSRLLQAEKQFLLGTGVLIGTEKHLSAPDRNQLTVELMSGEALTTSEIEGEVLNRASVQSSIQRQLGLTADKRRVAPAEQGISEMVVDLYRTYAEPLSSEVLFNWHRTLLAGRKDLRDIGRYRTSTDPMQVISGPSYSPRIHFEAPASKQVPAEMGGFIEWFNRTGPGNAQPLPALTRAGITHLYFESIHPFEDGNGRIGRAIAEKALVQSFAHPVLVALGTAILAHHRNYYEALEAANKKNEITDWLTWFAGISLEAQRRTTAQVEFLIDKTKLLDRLRGRLNRRQDKALQRMLREGPEGFKGGLSAGKYSTITGASPATATRDLADLVEKGALFRSGERKHARYVLNIPLRPVRRILINETGIVVER